MDREKLINTIYNYIRRNGGVSFVEIEQIFEKNGFDYIGDEMFIVPDMPNVVVWSSWNKEAFDILKEVMNRGMEMKPASPFIYYIDGKTLDLPLAKTAKGYKKKLHWLPVVMNIGKLYRNAAEKNNEQEK